MTAAASAALSSLTTSLSEIVVPSSSEGPSTRRTVAFDEDDLTSVPLEPQQVLSSRDHDGSSQGMSSATRPELKDIAKIFRESKRLNHVNMEQIERVRMMHDRFDEDASFSFNYNTLLLVASVLAACGLVSNSTTTVIASMLVSPIMGPVVGIAYGATIADYRLIRKSIFNEIVSLIACIIVGMLVAGIAGNTDLANDWPTAEMASRASISNLLVGLPVAFFSGLGVAVSLLDEQTNSLVGVAISASLLPPAVNAGIYWIAYAFKRVSSEENHVDNYLDLHDWEKGGRISLSLTLANIVLIWISGLLMFRMKEKLPIQKKVFWTDLGVARAIYQGRAILREAKLDDLVKGAELAALQAEESLRAKNAEVLAAVEEAVTEAEEVDVATNV